MAKNTNTHQKPAPSYRVHDKVWLNSKNIKAQCPSKKLDDNPYKILKKIGYASYKLDLPEEMNIHPVFHENLLRLDSEDPVQGQPLVVSRPVIIDGNKEWEVEIIQDTIIGCSIG